MNVFEEMEFLEEERIIEENYKLLIQDEEDEILTEGFIENTGIKIKLNKFRNEIANFVVDFDQLNKKDLKVAKKLRYSGYAKRLARVELAAKYLEASLKNPVIKQQYSKMSPTVLVHRQYGNTTVTYTVNIHRYVSKYTESYCKEERNRVCKELSKLSDKEKYSKLSAPAATIQPRIDKKFRKTYEALSAKRNEEVEVFSEGLFNKKPISMKEALPKIKENIKNRF